MLHSFLLENIKFFFFERTWRKDYRGSELKLKTE